MAARFDEKATLLDEKDASLDEMAVILDEKATLLDEMTASLDERGASLDRMAKSLYELDGLLDERATSLDKMAKSLGKSQDPQFAALLFIGVRSILMAILVYEMACIVANEPHTYGLVPLRFGSSVSMMCINELLFSFANVRNLLDRATASLPLSFVPLVSTLVVALVGVFSYYEALLFRLIFDGIQFYLGTHGA